MANLATVDLGIDTSQPLDPNKYPKEAGQALSYASAPASSGGGYTDQKAFITAVNQVRTKMESDNKLINAKNAVFKHMYDQPLTAEEKSALTPSLQHAISSGNRSMIDAAITGVNQQIKGYNNTIDTNLQAYATAVEQANTLKQDISKNILDYRVKGATDQQINDYITGMGLSPSDFNSSGVGMRTDRHMNPTAMTTDVAKTGGLVEGVDYVQGDPFTDSQGNTLYTARFLGDPIQTTIKAIDNMGFYTQSGQQRWSYIGMSQEQWMSLTPEQKANVVKSMYQHEGGNGTAIGMAPSGEMKGTIPTGVDTSGWNMEVLSGLNATEASQIASIASYKNAPLTRSTTYGSRIMGLVDQLNPAYDATNYASMQKMRTSASSGAIANVTMAANTAINHISTAKDSFDKLNNTGSQDANAVKNWMLTHTPDFLLTPSQREAKNSLVEVKSKLGALAGEIAKIYKNSTTGGASPSYQEIDEWENRFNENMTPGQFDAFVKSGMELMMGKIDPLQQQYQQTMGSQTISFLKQDSVDTLKNKFPAIYKELNLSDYSGGGVDTSSNNSGMTYKGYTLPY